MEKSRAIELLKLAVPIKALTQQEHADFVEAVNMAIDALKEQLSKQCATSDLISRQAAIDAVEKNACNTQRIIDAVNNLPPAQPEPKEGHWIGKYPTTYICSECGWLIPDSKVKVFAYCPNCGAKMTISK